MTNEMFKKVKIRFKNRTASRVITNDGTWYMLINKNPLEFGDDYVKVRYFEAGKTKVAKILSKNIKAIY